MSRTAISRLVRITLSVGLVLAAIWVVLNRQAVFDWVRLVQYTPSAEVKKLAEQDDLTDRGRDLFYVSDPQVQDKVDFNRSCTNTGEKTIVLGCYKMQQIFIYNVTDERLAGVQEVTAAHEMLHAAYERLSEDERSRVNELLKPIIQNMKDERILGLIKLYNEQEPGQLYNEMHSILGTEYADLSPELERYYKTYFADRSRIVGFAEQYRAPFVESQNKIADFDAQLDVLKPQIDQNNIALEQQQITLQSESDRLNRLRSAGALQQYNAAVPGYNELVRQFNSLIEETRSLVDQYNSLVEERNAQAAAENELQQSLDSNYTPVEQN